MLETEESWNCNRCAKDGEISRMTLVAETCLKCNEKRPARLKQKAEDFKKSAKGQAMKTAKRGRKKLSKDWTPAEWDAYRVERQDKFERGSVMSSNLADDTTVASALDVGDMEDFR